jgi:lipopolysaccharide transport system permease protein
VTSGAGAAVDAHANAKPGAGPHRRANADAAGSAGANTDAGDLAAVRSERARWREILLYQTYCQLRIESERLYVGYLWWAIETILEMALLYVVFRHLLGAHVEHYLSFLLCGLVSWRWLAQSVVRAAPSILSNQPLASQVFVPKLIFPLAMLLADAVKFSVGLVVLFVFLRMDGLAPVQALAWFPPVLAVQFVFIAAVSLWAAALVPFLRSILVGLDVALRFGMFVSGVFFELSRLGEPLRSWLAANPMAIILDAWRAVLMHGREPDLRALAVVAMLSIAAIAAVHAFVRRRELLYPRLPA